MRTLLIVVMCIIAAIIYGVLHDFVTTRVCIEYFTIGHTPVFGTEDPTLLALGWGVIATWWVGLFLGIALAAAARFGSRPPREPRTLLRPIAGLMVFSGLCALVMGVVGFILAEKGSVVLLEPMASEIPREKHARFLADLWAHTTSYAVGFVGGFVVCVRVWLSRREHFTIKSPPSLP
ncbi:MAG TPA: hypothetical protein VLM40_10850 [Gemmata sp.]|nr:hypothetical protein [Gemmata sp.]